MVYPFNRLLRLAGDTVGYVQNVYQDFQYYTDVWIAMNTYLKIQIRDLHIHRRGVLFYIIIRLSRLYKM